MRHFQGRLASTIAICVIYRPPTEPSIKRCISVNKRKKSGSTWTLDNNITRCPDGLSQLETGCQRENQLTDWWLCGPQSPMVEQPSQDEKEVLLWSRKNLGQYSHSFLTHNKHHLFDYKVWVIYIFIKKCVRSFVEVVIISWLCSRVYLITRSVQYNICSTYICICIRAVVCGYTTFVTAFIPRNNEIRKCMVRAKKDYSPYVRGGYRDISKTWK